MKRIILISIIFIVGLSACEDRFTQVVDLDIPPHESKLVTYCIIDAAQDTILVEVSESQEITVEEDPVITNAFIRFLKDDQLITDDFDLIKRFVDLDYSTPQLDSIFAYYYVSTIDDTPEAGTEFQLEVLSPGLDPVSAITRVPDKVALESAEFIKDGIIDPEGYSSDELKINFTDPGDEENYYLLSAKIKEWYGSTSYTHDAYISGIDPRINQSYYGAPIVKDLYNYVYFNDKEGIDGNKNQFIFSLNIYNGPDVEKLELQIKLYTLSKELYDFTHALNQYSKSNDALFSEPVSIPSNFENGYGVFGIYDHTEIKLEL